MRGGHDCQKTSNHFSLLVDALLVLRMLAQAPGQADWCELAYSPHKRTILCASCLRKGANSEQVERTSSVFTSSTVCKN